MNGGWSISYEIALRWMPLALTDNKSTVVQVMAWCRQATRHFLSQCWHRSMSPNGVTRPQWVKNAQGCYMKPLKPPGYFEIFRCNVTLKSKDARLFNGVDTHDFKVSEHDSYRYFLLVLKFPRLHVEETFGFHPISESKDYINFPRLHVAETFGFYAMSGNKGYIKLTHAI